MRKIFLDCGAHKGESVTRFRELFPDATKFEIFCFEPHEGLRLNPGFRQNDLNITLIPKAVWVEDGHVNFFEAGVSPAGSTIFKDKTTWQISRKPVRIPCVDFSAWMRRRLSPEDFIVLKMNIEGAEYDVLGRMLADGTLGWVDRLYVSFHFRKIPSISKKRHKMIVEAIKKSGQTVLKWWGDKPG